MERLTLHLVLALLLAIQPVAGAARFCSRTSAAMKSDSCCCATLACDRASSGCGCFGEAPQTPAPQPQRAEPMHHEVAIVPAGFRLADEGECRTTPRRVVMEAPFSPPSRAVLCIWLT